MPAYGGGWGGGGGPLGAAPTAGPVLAGLVAIVLGQLEIALGVLPTFLSFTAMLLCCGFVAQMFLPPTTGGTGIRRPFR
ncbi:MULTISPECIES: hypothetical protein [unclassified Streptomyces]|uniref:hypothetical protein n=1 Tax=unclassified Streptomyces TaxID=2593676 RepID=UPI0034007902